MSSIEGKKMTFYYFFLVLDVDRKLTMNTPSTENISSFADKKLNYFNVIGLKENCFQSLTTGGGTSGFADNGIAIDVLGGKFNWIRFSNQFRFL